MISVLMFYLFLPCQLPVSVMWTMVAVITTVLRLYRATSAPAILDTHWTLTNILALVSLNLV